MAKRNKITSCKTKNNRLDLKLAKVRLTMYIINKIYKIKAKHIPTLPDKVEINDIKDYLKDLTAVPIGISKKNLDVYTYNFKKSFVNIITSKNIESSIEFISHILEEVKQLENPDIYVASEIFSADGVKLGSFEKEKTLTNIH